MSVTSMLNTTAKFIHFTTVKGTMGGAKEVEEVIATGIPCRIEALSGTERAMRGSTGVLVTHRMFCFVLDGVTVTEADEIEIAGVRYEIAFVDSVQAHHLEIELVERRQSGG